MEKQFKYLGAEVNYKIVGKGQPVVLIHGFAEDSSIWNDQSTFLQQYCKLLIPDLPGSGRSEMLPKEGAAIEDYAAFVNAVLIQENIEKCIVLGHSMGGYITLAFADLYPEKLLGFGLVHSTAFADNEEKKATRQKGIKLIEEYGVFPFLKSTTPNLFTENYKKQDPEKVWELIERGKDFSQRALVNYYSAMMKRPDRTFVLRGSNVPVLFVIGSEDKAAPLEDLLQQVHLPQTAFVHIIDNAAHMSMWEDPDKLNSCLFDFISG